LNEKSNLLTENTQSIGEIFTYEVEKKMVRNLFIGIFAGIFFGFFLVIGKGFVNFYRSFNIKNLPS